MTRAQLIASFRVTLHQAMDAFDELAAQEASDPREIIATLAELWARILPEFGEGNGRAHLVGELIGVATEAAKTNDRARGRQAVLALYNSGFEAW